MEEPRREPRRAASKELLGDGATHAKLLLPETCTTPSYTSAILLCYITSNAGMGNIVLSNNTSTALMHENTTTLV